MERKVKWGIAGLGNIANKFAADLIKNSESDLVAVASSNFNRAMKFKSIYGAKRGIDIFYKNDGKNKYFINGIENRMEQIIANLLDNAISFSKDNSEIIVQTSKAKGTKCSLCWKITEEPCARISCSQRTV